MKKYKWIDKSKWPEGIWNLESDRICWIDKATGYLCDVVRINEEGKGHLCGYVGIPKEKFDVDYNFYEDSGNYFDIHGGLTYRGERAYCTYNSGDIYWIGFDCNHSSDRCPWSTHATKNCKYWREEQVIKETERLAEQLKPLEGKKLYYSQEDAAQERNKYKKTLSDLGNVFSDMAFEAIHLLRTYEAVSNKLFPSYLNEIKRLESRFSELMKGMENFAYQMKAVGNTRNGE